MHTLIRPRKLVEKAKHKKLVTVILTMFNDLLLMMSVYWYCHVAMRLTRMSQRFWKQRCMADVCTNAYEIQVSASWLGRGSGWVYKNTSNILEATVHCGRLSKHIRAPSIRMVVRIWFLFYKNISKILGITVNSRYLGKHIRVPSISMVVRMWFLVATHHALPRCNVIDCKTPTHDRQDHY